MEVPDIIYIKTNEGWLFLAAFLDLYSRKIVGWNMSPSLDTQLILSAFQLALLNRQAGPTCSSIPTAAFNMPQATTAGSWPAPHWSLPWAAKAIAKITPSWKASGVR
jgi:transposase InsO family protein